MKSQGVIIYKILLMLLLPLSSVAAETTPAETPEAFLTTPTLVFLLAIAALAAAVFLIKYTKYSWTPYSVIRLIGLILILIISLFLIIAPEISKDKVTQIVGLLGAIGGYLLGKDPRELDINHKGAKTQKADPQKIPAPPASAPTE